MNKSRMIILGYGIKLSINRVINYCDLYLNKFTNKTPLNKFINYFTTLIYMHIITIPSL